jgi:hypothetical protein
MLPSAMDMKDYRREVIWVTFHKLLRPFYFRIADHSNTNFCIVLKKHVLFRNWLVSWCWGELQFIGFALHPFNDTFFSHHRVCSNTQINFLHVADHWEYDLYEVFGDARFRKVP